MENEFSINEVRASLKSENKQFVLNALHQIKHAGKPQIIPDLIELLDCNTDDSIEKEIYMLLGGLKDQNCAPYIVDIFNNNKHEKHFAKIIATCWQSHLDYSNHLETFANLFIDGSYEIAIESFTVIEETAMNTPRAKANQCKAYLLDNKQKIAHEKEPLFNELIKALSA